jgi:hypothetical protein
LPKPKTAAETLVALGVTLAGAEASAPTPATCKRCKSTHDSQKSSSRYPSIFCSKSCEGEFIRKELVSLTLDDCIRLHSKLERLLRAIQEPLPFEGSRSH